MLAHIGIDDTDSPRKGCTTYVAAVLAEELAKLGVRFVDYPNLVRLNPNAPWKTRGNGAVCLRFEVEDEGMAEEAFLKAVELVEKLSDLEHEGTDPGVVMLIGPVPLALRLFAKKAIRGLVGPEETLRLLSLIHI